MDKKKPKVLTLFTSFKPQRKVDGVSVLSKDNHFLKQKTEK